MAKLQRNYDDLKYQPGFGNDHVTEALPDAIPKTQNSPQRCPYGLYNEQLSGTPFTKPRAQNLRTWLYRIMPSPHRGEYSPVDYNPNVIGNFTTSEDVVITPERKRFNPMEFPKEDKNFVQGLFTICGAGNPEMHLGLNYQIFACNTSMTNIAYVNCDGDYLIFPTEGTLYIVTEFGKLTCSPHEFVVIPRAIKFSVEVTGPTRGYCFETYKGHFKLPELGQMGANGLASPRHFEAPVAYYEDSTEEYTLICKFIGKFHQCKLDHSPFDVVAWWGNYYPFRYNLDLYNLYSTVTWDHPDASLYSVLQVPSDEPGMNIADIQLFPPRWWVAEHTLRPNYFHRNHQNEIVGKLWDDKQAVAYYSNEGFEPGSVTLFNTFTAHGLDCNSWMRAATMELKPVYFSSTFFFLIETSFMMKINKNALTEDKLWPDFHKQNVGYARNFNKDKKEPDWHVKKE